MNKHENEIVIFQDPQSNETIKVPDIIPILPVRNMVLFPFSVLPLTVGRESSTKLIEDVGSADNRYLGVIAQRDPSVDEPQEIDLFSIGTLAVVSKQVRVKDNNLVAIVQGLKRFRIREYVQTHPFFKARVEPLDDIVSVQNESKAEAMRRSIEALFQQIVTLS